MARGSNGRSAVGRRFLFVSIRCALVGALALGGALAVGTPTVHALSGATSFTFTSAPGDYVGQGLTESFDSSGATFTTRSPSKIAVET